TGLHPNQPVIQLAAVGVARPDHRLRSTAHRVGAPVEPQAVHLLVGTVTLIAMVTEDRLNVTPEVHTRRNLGDEASGRKRREEDCKSGQAQRDHRGIIWLTHRLHYRDLPASFT